MFGKKTRLLLTIFIFSFSFIPFLWLSGHQVLLGYDLVFPLKFPQFLLDRIFSWTTVSGFDSDRSGIQGSIVIHFIDSLPLMFGASYQLAEKIVFSFWFFMLIFSAYIFAKKMETMGFIKNEYVKYIFPILYSFNFYILQAWWVAERTKFSLVVALPLILTLIFPFIKGHIKLKEVFRKSFITIFILSIFNGGGWVGIPLYGGLILAFVCFYVFSVFIFLNRKSKSDIVNLSLYFILLPFLFVLLNAYSILPFLSTTLHQFSSIAASVGGVDGLINWTKYLSANAGFMNLLRLQGIPDWYNGFEFHPYAKIFLTNVFLIGISYVFPVLILLTFLKNKDKFIKFFILFFLVVSIFFTSGIHEPFGFVFEALMRGIPGFVVFRSAIFKFGYAYWMASSFLIAVSLSEIIEYLSTKTSIKKRYFISLFTLIVFIVCLVFYHFPYLTGNIFHIEATSVGTRVDLPQYVSDFSSWWEKNGKEERVLLLPKLNNTWYFEQYNWKYMSTSPILENFANKNTIENVVNLTEDERSLVNSLYGSIKEEDFKQTDVFLQALSIDYFLVRKDFYWNYPNQETDDPLKIENSLIKNPSIVKVKDFGQWSLYRYGKKSPLVYAKTNAIEVSGTDTTEQYFFDDHSLFFEGNIPNPDTVSNSIVVPHCLNCVFYREDLSLQIPKPKILINSGLYMIFNLKDKIFTPAIQSPDEKIGNLLGDTLQMSGQINELLSQEGDNSKYIQIAKNQIVSDFDAISKEADNLIAQSVSPYKTFVTIQQYLSQEDRYFTGISINKQSVQKDLKEIVNRINILNDKISQYYPKEDTSITKRYSFSIPESENYSFKINKRSLGSLRDSKEINISLVIDRKNTISLTGLSRGDYFDFGQIYLEGGTHYLEANFPLQKNLAENGYISLMSDKKCMTYVLNNFSAQKAYGLSFQFANKTDSNFYLAINDDDEDLSSVNSLIPLSESKNINQLVISSKKMTLKDSSDRLVFAFCSDNLTKEIYDKSILDLNLVELTNPAIVFYRTVNSSFNKIPVISFNQKDQSQMEIKIDQISGPFYLVINNKYSPAWKASTGEHLIGNKINNVWYIDTDKKNLVVKINYSPQKYFYIGAVISLVSLLIGILIYRKILK